eukprot:CAMPEP_0201520114 /NCGR_PEP_ID=MMETSP0161_2-20130828/10497_1 /ASSEMBLY_ACC=CAM_ASM_000251 /TAXON_ID=180227 /ORGANISM="Neoparamoeba aestuarina, Strain SoJaBio B1-5/56/2" /LENGTH=176 /DNA_ID=CAMNT_0047918381 /DNA_START=387 /DNA_END=917 /DNA_ORIENTATION=+
MARIAMQAPPHAALVLVAMMYNLLVRHPTCQALLHRERKQKKPDFVLMLGAPTEEKKEEKEEEKEERKGKGGGSGDPFRPNVKQPAKAKAMESSLWEITALKSHYSPTVARFAKIFDKPLPEKRQTIDLSDFLTCSYTSLFDTEVKKNPKVISLEHDKSNDLFEPEMLFDSPIFQN